MARIAGVNIPQNKIVQVGLTYIYGIGDKFSKQICKDLDISKSTRVNQLSDDQILKIREYIDNILTKLTTIGALYLTLVCLMPEFLIANYPIPFYLGGTSILIVVVVAIDTVTQIQTRMMSSQYEQLIKKTKFGR